MASGLDSPGQTALLFDLYGSLLTERQAEVMDLRLNEDHSLAEIAQRLGMSRQSAHDAIRAGCAALAAYEHKLGLAQAEADRERASEALQVLCREARGLTPLLESAAAALAQAFSSLTQTAAAASRVAEAAKNAALLVEGTEPTCGASDDTACMTEDTI